jgi:hypothetical protein
MMDAPNGEQVQKQVIASLEPAGRRDHFCNRIKIAALRQNKRHRV